LRRLDFGSRPQVLTGSLDGYLTAGSLGRMKPLPLPAELRAAPFTVSEAASVGIGEKRLRGSDLFSPHHGVRSMRAPSGIRERCLAYLPLLRPGQAFSHVSAASLWGLPVPRAISPGVLHVVFTGARGPRRPGVVGHFDSAPNLMFFGEIPVSSPLDVWAQCSTLLELDDLVAMGDALAGRWSGQPEARERPLAELEASVIRWGRRRGARRLREALELVRARVWSPRETALRLLIVRAGLPEPPELNADVRADDDTWLGCSDMVYRARRLAVEYQGDQHRTDKRQWRNDVRRRERYVDAGWRMLEVTDDDLIAPNDFLVRLAGLLR